MFLYSKLRDGCLCSSDPMCFSILDPKKETDHFQTLSFEFERKKGLETEPLRDNRARTLAKRMRRTN